MIRKLLLGLFALVILAVLYLLLWPVPIDPVAWDAPPNPGHNGPFAENGRLKDLETLPLGDFRGPEEIILDARGRIYATTHDGAIVRLQADGSSPRLWAKTGGRPLGIVFDGAGNLIVADSMRGLLSIAPDATISVLAEEADGLPILFANNVDVAADGKIYFSDASTKFSPKVFAGTLAATLLDVMEHGSHGRLLVYDPATGKATTVMDGFSYANGVAVSEDQQFVLVADMENYRVIRIWIAGARAGSKDILIDELPGFPDNITTGKKGRFWIAFASPRNNLVDNLSNSPFLRKIIQRFPAFLRPKPVHYGHVIAVDGEGKVVANLQDPQGGYPITTSATETGDYLYIGSLSAPVIGRLKLSRIGF